MGRLNAPILRSRSPRGGALFQTVIAPTGLAQWWLRTRSDRQAAFAGAEGSGGLANVAIT
jgi:hypothetical protein